LPGVEKGSEEDMKRAREQSKNLGLAYTRGIDA
jgi:hypothetical protein